MGGGCVMSNLSASGWSGQRNSGSQWISNADAGMGLNLAQQYGGGGSGPPRRDPRAEERRRRRRRLLRIVASLAVAVVFITVPTEADPVFYIVAFGALGIAAVESIRAVAARVHGRASPGR